MYCSVLYLTLFVLFVECICPSHAGEVSRSTCSHVKLIWLIQIMSLLNSSYCWRFQYVTSGGSDNLTHRTEEIGESWPTAHLPQTKDGHTQDARPSHFKHHDYHTSSITTIPGRPTDEDQLHTDNSFRVNCIGNNTVEVTIKRNRIRWNKFNDKFNRNGKETIWFKC